VSAVDNAGNESARSTATGNATTPACPDTIAPGVPGAMSATASSCSNVNLSWGAVIDTGGSGLRGYYVWRNGSRLTALSAPLAATTFTDSGLSQQTAYSYKVSAVDNAGNESAQSTTAATATTPQCTTSTPGSYVSGQRFGGTGIDAGYAVAAAPDGSSAIAGEFAGTASFG